MTAQPPTVFWGNERVRQAALSETWREATRARLTGEGRVLLGQDPPRLDFSGYAAVDGLGILARAGRGGGLVSSPLAVSETGLPLGVVAQRGWVRPAAALGQRAQRQETAVEDTASDQWVDGIRDGRSGQGWAPGLPVGDRAAPRYEFWAATGAAKLDFMGRAASGRSVTRAGADGFEALALAPGATETTLRVNRRPDRDARVHLRFGTLTLRRPQRSTRTPDGLTVQGVEGVERQPPADAAPSHGRLLTSLPLETPEQAQPIVTCYPDRWRIERFHYPLNRGGKLQASPWRTQARLERWRAV